MQHVILGAGPAGVIAAETIRKHAPNDKVILVGDEPEAPYSRMAIPYLLMNNIAEEGTHLRHGADHYQKLGIEVRRARAKTIDTVKRTVLLEDGSTIECGIGNVSQAVAEFLKGIAMLHQDTEGLRILQEGRASPSQVDAVMREVMV